MRIPTKRQRTAKLFFAMGHQRRLKILDALEGSLVPLTYEQIEVETRIPQGSLTHHLRILLEVGLVKRKIKSKYSFYEPNRALLVGFPHISQNTLADLAA